MRMDAMVSGQEKRHCCCMGKTSRWNLTNFHSSSLDGPITDHPPCARNYGVLQTWNKTWLPFSSSHALPLQPWLHLDLSVLEDREELHPRRVLSCLFWLVSKGERRIIPPFFYPWFFLPISPMKILQKREPLNCPYGPWNILSQRRVLEGVFQEQVSHDSPKKWVMTLLPWLRTSGNIWDTFGYLHGGRRGANRCIRSRGWGCC